MRWKNTLSQPSQRRRGKNSPNFREAQEQLCTPVIGDSHREAFAGVTRERVSAGRFRRVADPPRSKGVSRVSRPGRGPPPQLGLSERIWPMPRTCRCIEPGAVRSGLDETCRGWRNPVESGRGWMDPIESSRSWKDQVESGRGWMDAIESSRSWKDQVESGRGWKNQVESGWVRVVGVPLRSGSDPPGTAVDAGSCGVTLSSMGEGIARREGAGHRAGGTVEGCALGQRMDCPADDSRPTAGPGMLVTADRKGQTKRRRRAGARRLDLAIPEDCLPCATLRLAAARLVATEWAGEGICRAPLAVSGSLTIDGQARTVFATTARSATARRSTIERSQGTI